MPRGLKSLRKKMVLISAAFAFMLMPRDAGAEEAPQIRASSGVLAGASENGVESFKGIPFAAPPVGSLRWRAPQPVQQWSGIRPAIEYAPDCMQTPVAGINAPLGADSLSEDCLYLNVWRPAGAKPSSGLPVMVWIHGGGFVNGGASPAVFRGDSFARQDVIMVGIAYRVGRFGFFAHPALTAANEDAGLLGNYGFMDQIAALHWVRDNIAAFGGDPKRVTIFGESAGGWSVHMLLTSPLAKGLFAGAIVQSGGGRGNLMGTRYVRQDNGRVPSLETVGLAFARSNGIEGQGPEALKELRALAAEKVTAGLNMRTMMAQTTTYGGPSIDGKIVIASPDQSYRRGTQERVPLIIGATSADIGMLSGPKERVFALFGSQATAARRAYDPTGTADDASVAAAVGGDMAMVEPSRYVAGLFSDRGLPAWQFRFSYVADSLRDKMKGAPHASDIPYVMDTVRHRYGEATTARDEAMGKIMNRYWANFAKTGNPNGAGLPQWPRYDPKADILMDFSEEGEAVAMPDPRRERLDLIASMAKE